ncbi:helix-turn-helix transcriptional regulator [Ferrimonas senticii]|uniref:helix-turn-helix transcriptional regulator n=1 Tax=Ferrimonas senticii TaxID=394566 RepID=UPI000408906D|nr:AlpA family phage regulatory protein [Ferrimonas senticii]
MKSKSSTFIDRLVREPERKQITSISRTTAWELERKNLFPKRRKLHANSDAVAWLLSELIDWVQSRELAAPEQTQ